MRHAMNYKMIAKIISFILLIETAFMIPAILFGLYYHESHAVISIIKSQVIILIVAGILYYYSKDAKKGYYAREGFVTTGLAWIMMSALGCLPFVLSGEIPNYIDALFETVSGFTTTGSSILANVEEMSKSLLYWRSFTHWVGGMGILVFLMAVVPLTGKNEGFSIHILRAESPGPSVGKLVPRMKQSNSILYWIYIGLTILNLIFLLIGRMPFFDAICTALGTAGTGGFGVKADSIASYSPYIQNVTTVFMILFGVNFSCYYLLILKRVKEVALDEELRSYLIIIASSIILITWNLSSAGVFSTLSETIRHSAFAVGTIISTTGFATADFDLWPGFSKAIILFLMFSGACAGSTGGGIKVSRILLLLKSFRRNFHVNLHPGEVRKVRFNKVPVDEKVLKNVQGYFIAYCGILMVSFLLISIDGFDVETNISAVMATFNNIGPGFAVVGPTANFASFSYFSKIILIFNMLAGRLEIFPMMVLLSKSTWKKQ